MIPARLGFSLTQASCSALLSLQGRSQNQTCKKGDSTARGILAMILCFQLLVIRRNDKIFQHIVLMQHLDSHEDHAYCQHQL